jgi:hypothetical protein
VDVDGREAAKGENPEAIKNALRDLQQGIAAMGQAMYSKAGGGEGAGPAPGGAAGPKEDDAIDVEFNEKK